MISGLQGSTYPEDREGQRQVLLPLIQPIVDKVMGEGTPFDLNPRRGTLRGMMGRIWSYDIPTNSFTFVTRYNPTSM